MMGQVKMMECECDSVSQTANKVKECKNKYMWILNQTVYFLKINVELHL